MDIWNYFIDKNESMSVISEYGFDDKKIIEFNPDIVICFDINQVSRTFECLLDFCKMFLKVPIAIMIDDFFHINFFESSRHDLVDAIVLKVKNDNTKLEYKEKFPNKIIKSLDTHYINVRNFHSWEQDKEYDIFIYGSRNVVLNKDIHSSVYNKYKKLGGKEEENFNFYEFRKRVINLVCACGKYNMKVLKEEPQTNCRIRGEELSKEINKSYMSLATKCPADKCMMKYIEISASDSIILGDIPSDYKDLFEGNMVEIREDMSDEQILDIIDKALVDKKSLENRAREFGKKIREKYGSDRDNCANDFSIILKEIIEEYNFIYQGSNHS
jgi:hypothetical protein